MTPRPSTPHADQILGPYWESSITPEALSHWAIELGKAATEMGFIAGDGQVEALRLLGFGQGALAEAISDAWVQFFVNIGTTATQFAEAGAVVTAWAESLGAMLAAMSGCVDWAEASITALELARVPLELAGENVDDLIQTVIAEAHSQVASISTSAIAGLAALPGWVGAGAGPPPAGVPVGVPGNPAGTSSGGLPQGAPVAPMGMPTPGNPTGISSGGGPPGTPAVPQGTPGLANPAGVSSGGAPPGGPMLSPGTPAVANPAAMSPGGVPTNPTAMPSGVPSAGVPGTGVSPTAGTPSAGVPGTGMPSAPTATGTGVPGASPMGMGTPATGAPATGAPATGAPAATGTPATGTPPAATLSQASGVTGVAGVDAQAAAVAPTGAVTGAVASPVASMGSAAAAAAGPIAAAPAGAVGGAAAPLAASAVTVAATPVAPSAIPSVTPVAPTAAAVAPPPITAASPAQTGVHLPATAASNAPTVATPPSPGPQPHTGQHTPAPTGSPIAHDTDGQAAEDASAAAAPLLVPVDDAAILPVPLGVRTPIDEPRQVVDLDLATVRTVLEAAGGGSAARWAAGMVVTGGRRQVVFTTDRGRGWLPPNVLMPEDAVLPWPHPDSVRWEGLLDPARVIIEYAAATGGTLTALASTHSSAPAVAAGVPFVFADTVQRPRPDLATGPLVRRETFGVSPERLAAAEAIADPADQRRQAVWIAHDAVEKAGEGSAVRRSILASLNADPTLSEPRKLERLGWDALIDENEVLWEKDIAARIDVRNVEIGRLDTGGGKCRPVLVQSYATEAVLALRNASPRQALLDALYSWSMLLELIDTDREAVPA